MNNFLRRYTSEPPNFFTIGSVIYRTRRKSSSPNARHFYELSPHSDSTGIHSTYNSIDNFRVSKTTQFSEVITSAVAIPTSSESRNKPRDL